MTLLRKAAAVVAIAILLPACIKENRNKVPVQLTVDLSKTGMPIGESSLFITVVDNSGPYREEVSTAGHPGLVNFKVIPGNVALSGVTASPGSALTGFSLTASSGQEFPLAYAFCESLKARRDENVYVTPELHKQAAKITVTTLHSTPALTEVTVSATSNGFFLFDLSPVNDGYSLSVSKEGGDFPFVLPRQSDNAASLTIKTLEGTSDIALGKMLAAKGYSWSEKDLKDIQFVFDQKNPSASYILF